MGLVAVEVHLSSSVYLNVQREIAGFPSALRDRQDHRIGMRQRRADLAGSQMGCLRFVSRHQPDVSRSEVRSELGRNSQGSEQGPTNLGLSPHHAPGDDGASTPCAARPRWRSGRFGQPGGRGRTWPLPGVIWDVIWVRPHSNGGSIFRR
jgi:hypothetical protein